MGIILIGDLADLLEMLEEIDVPDYNNEQFEGWFCIQHSPIPCHSCGSPVCYVEPPGIHLIVVWEEKDDVDMLRMASRIKAIKSMNLDPIIIPYAPIYGNCIPYQEVRRLNDE